MTVGEGAGAKRVGILEAGEVFGEMSLIDPGPRSATVRALTATECLVTGYEEFVATAQANPQQSAEFMKTLVRRQRQMNERIARMNPAWAIASSSRSR